jgi:hypothetical protein
MLPNVNWFLPYKEEVTGSNPVAPTRVFQKYSKKKPVRTHKTPTCYGIIDYEKLLC